MGPLALLGGYALMGLAGYLTQKSGEKEQRKIAEKQEILTREQMQQQQMQFGFDALTKQRDKYRSAGNAYNFNNALYGVLQEKSIVQ